MMRRLAPLILLWLTPAVAFGQTPPNSVAVHDEALLRQAGVGTDAPSLLKLLHDYTHGNGDGKKVEALLVQLGHAEFEKREHASRELIAIGRPALPPLRTARKTDPDPEVRLRAGHCIEAIENSLEANVVFSAVRRLGYLRTAGAAEPLLAILPEADWETQDEIYHQLPRVALADGKIDPVLFAALEDKAPFRRAAAALAVALAGTPAERKPVRRLLTDPDAQVRLRAAQGLLAVGEPDSLPALIALLNEPQVEISWSAEELLHWSAGDTAPAATVGGATLAERTKVVADWNEWHKNFAAKLDWIQLAKTTRRPGLCFICERGRTWLCGCDARPRWTIPGSLSCHDVQLLPDNQLLLATFNGEGHLLCRQINGKEIWRHVDRNGDDFLACQRLPNGNFFVVTEENVCEITSNGQQVAMRPYDSSSPGDAWMLRNGHILCRQQQGVAEFDGFTGPELRNNPIEQVCFNYDCTFAVRPDGGCVVADFRQNRVIEVDRTGKTVRILPVRGAWGVEALRNGNLLVSTLRDGRVVEIDSEGRAVWEVTVRPRPLRVRAVLDKLCIGFDKPRPADFNLDSATARVRGLKDPDVQVRRRAAEFLAYLKPTDEASVTAVLAALEDPQPEVRQLVANALAQIGTPALPGLLQTLKYGTKNSRTGAASALQQMGPAARPVCAELIDMVRNVKLDAAVRAEAASILGTIGPEAKDSVPVLLGLLGGDDDLLRSRICGALANIDPGNAAVLTGLVGALKDAKYPQGRLSAVRALSLLGTTAKPVLPDLIAVVQAVDNAENLRTLSVNALGNMGPEAKAAAPALLAILKDARQPVNLRSTVAQELGRVGPDPKVVVPVYTDLLRDPKVSSDFATALIAGLGVLGRDGVPGLTEALKKGVNAPVRRLAITKLIELGDLAKPAVPALKEAAKDPDPVIGRLASRAATIIENGMEGRGRKVP